MMTVVEMKERLLEEYPLQIQEIREVTSRLYRVRAEEGEWRLVQVHVKPSKVIFAYTVVNHLTERGFAQVLQIGLTREGEPYFEYANRYWILLEWVQGSQPELMRLDEVECVTRELARMHRYMAGVYLEGAGKGKAAWTEWPETVVQGRNLLEIYMRRVLRQPLSSEFDRILVQARERLQERMDRAVELTHSPSCQQMIMTEQEERSMAWRWVREKEMLLGFDGRIYFTNPFQVHYDVRVKDLGRWIKRFIRKNPDFRTLLPRVLGWYEDERPLSRGEKEWLLSYLLYPGRVVKILERYVLRKRHWAEEGYVQKLQKALTGAAKEMDAYRVMARYFDHAE